MDIKDKSAVPQSGSPAQAQGNDAAVNQAGEQDAAALRALRQRAERIETGCALLIDALTAAEGRDFNRTDALNFVVGYLGAGSPRWSEAEALLKRFPR